MSFHYASFSDLFSELEYIYFLFGNVTKILSRKAVSQQLSFTTFASWGNQLENGYRNKQNQAKISYGFKLILISERRGDKI
jgi:hypothetical protein